MFALYQSALTLGRKILGRKILNKGRLPAFAIAAGMTLAACDPAMMGTIGGGGAKINVDKPIPVALLVPRGSGGAGDEVLAQALEDAARLAMRDLDGVTIDLRVYTTAGKADVAATQAAQAVNDGAKIILGPLYGEAANAAGVAVAGKNVNVLAFSNNPTIAGGNVFILGPTFQNTANRLVGYAKTQGKDRIVVVHSDDIAGQLGRNAISNAVTANGATLAGAVDYPLSQQGVVSAIAKVRTAVSSGGANAVFMTSPSASALPLLTQLLPEAGVKPETTQFIGLTRWDIPVQTLALPGVQGGWFALPDPKRSAAFAAKFQGAYGRAPHPVASLAFDGIAAIGALATSKGSDALTSAALTQGAGFQGSTGIFRLRADGTNDRGLAVATVREKQVVVISNAPAGFGGAGF